MPCFLTIYLQKAVLIPCNVISDDKECGGSCVDVIPVVKGAPRRCGVCKFDEYIYMELADVDCIGRLSDTKGFRKA